MMRWVLLVAGLGAVVACRQPNPEWMGADGSGTTTTMMPPPPPMTTTGDVTGEGTSFIGSSSAAVETDTLGQDCNNDNTCPSPLVCGPDGSCQLGTEGDPCVIDNDCVPPFGLCGPMDMCQDGDEGDPCTVDTQCAAPSDHCGPDGMCHDGSENDPCVNPEDCGDEFPLCGDGTCQDGSEDDPCDADMDCVDPTGLCGPANTCHAGAAGDSCLANNHCAMGLTCMGVVCG